MCCCCNLKLETYKHHFPYYWYEFCARHNVFFFLCLRNKNEKCDFCVIYRFRILIHNIISNQRYVISYRYLVSIIRDCHVRVRLGFDNIMLVVRSCCIRIDFSFFFFFSIHRTLQSHVCREREIRLKSKTTAIFQVWRSGIFLKNNYIVEDVFPLFYVLWKYTYLYVYFRNNLIFVRSILY